MEPQVRVFLILIGIAIFAVLLFLVFGIIGFINLLTPTPAPTPTPVLTPTDTPTPTPAPSTTTTPTSPLISPTIFQIQELRNSPGHLVYKFEPQNLMSLR
jgi:hypothetical protein